MYPFDADYPVLRHPVPPEIPTVTILVVFLSVFFLCTWVHDLDTPALLLPSLQIQFCSLLK